MTHRTTTRFWASFSRFPESAQRTARRNFDIFKTNPAHPSLHFKKVGKLWSVRAGPHHRALAVEAGSDFIWVWISPHDEWKRGAIRVGYKKNPVRYKIYRCGCGRDQRLQELWGAEKK